MLYTTYFLILMALNSEGKVVEYKTMLQTNYLTICEMNKAYLQQTIQVEEGQTLKAVCKPVRRTAV